MATGTRIRYNLSKGRIGASLTTGDTTLDLGEDPGWSTLGVGEYIALTLSDTEIVHVTAYTAGAQTCTMERGQEGTTAVSHDNAAPWVLAQTTLDHELGELSGLGDDALTQYLNTARHDVTARHPLTALGTDGLGLGLRNIRVFTTSGSWSKPSWLRAARICVVGGGGGGGAASSTQGSSGGGGGGAAYAESLIDAASLGATEVVTVGAGGMGGATGANDGSDGSPSSFGAHVVADFGDGGGHNDGATQPSADYGGAGGASASTGEITVSGSHGGFPMHVESRSLTNGYTIAGMGGAAGGPFGGGGGIGFTLLQGGSGVGGEGRSYGGGGGGGCNDGGGANAGGNGAAGVVIVYEYA